MSPTSSGRILIVDDDERQLQALRRLLRTRGYEVDIETRPERCHQWIAGTDYDCVLLDIQFDGSDGRDLLREIHGEHPHLPVIMISGVGSIQTAIECIRAGALHFIEKPINPDILYIELTNAIRFRRMHREVEAAWNEIGRHYRMVGASEVMQVLFRTVARVAATDAPVLIEGESGTGKELVARAIHFHSMRKGKSFLQVNCARLSDPFLESELFGHTRGAFTGALSARDGKFVTADGGTLFLDEIGEMPTGLQGKLLRALEQGEIEVLGADVPRTVDVRIVAATNRDLRSAVAEGRFREDLFYRLDVLHLRVPALRNRRDDILPLTFFFLEEDCRKYGKEGVELLPEAAAVLKAHSWPGNVRELRNVVSRLVLMHSDRVVDAEAVREAIRPPTDGGPQERPSGEGDGESLLLKAVMEAVEHAHLVRVLEKMDWKVGEAAEALGINRTSLYRKMQMYGIEGRSGSGTNEA